MKQSFIRSACLFACQLACLGGLLSSPCAQAQQSSPKAAVRLKAATVVTSSNVRLGDVADIIDADQGRRAQLEDLDLAVFNQEEPIVLDRDFIGIRIQLAGFETASIAITGEKQVKISPPVVVSLTDLGIEDAAHAVICRQFAVAPEDLRVKLTSPFLSTVVLDSFKAAAPRIEVIPSVQLPLGRSQLTVRVFDGEKLLLAKPAMFDVARRQNVVIATTSLDRLHELTGDYVTEEMRFVDTQVDRLSSDQVIGRQLLTSIRAGDILSRRHVGEVVVEAPPILVHAHDPVKLIAKKGRLTVTIPVAEAIQSGREGQTIRVRNLQSGQIVAGQVIKKGEVLVALP